MIQFYQNQQINVKCRVLAVISEANTNIIKAFVIKEWAWFHLK